MSHAIVGGAGLGTTIALRTAVAYPEHVQAMVLINVEDIEDDVRMLHDRHDHGQLRPGDRGNGMSRRVVRDRDLHLDTHSR